MKLTWGGGGSSAAVTDINDLEMGDHSGLSQQAQSSPTDFSQAALFEVIPTNDKGSER